MEVGHIFTIEPIIMVKNRSEIKMWSDGWTVVANGIPSAQWEHMILITPNGAEMLTERAEDREEDFLKKFQAEYLK